MAFLTAIPAWVGTAASIAGSVYSASQQQQAGLDQATERTRQANLQASQLEESAKQDQAVSQRRASEQMRRARLMQSRAQAVAAASGGGASDPDVVSMMAGLEAEGDLAARNELYAGDESAYGKRRQGSQGIIDAMAAAKSYTKAGKTNAFGTILSGLSSMYR